MPATSFALTASARAAALLRCQRRIASHHSIRAGAAAVTSFVEASHASSSSSSSSIPPSSSGTRGRNYTSISSDDVVERTKRMLKAKSDSGLSYDDIAKILGVTNTYAAQLLLGQAKLTNETATKLRDALPNARPEDVEDMISSFPMRTFDESILKEPNVYRTYEAITHYGEAIKSIINEQCGDGAFLLF
jgi:cyanate lyase